MKSKLVGHLWQMRWFNPYTEPPGPRVLAEMFVPLRSRKAGAGSAPEEIVNFPAPQGYSLACQGIATPMEPKTPEQLAKIRMQHLERRAFRKAPLFAEHMISEALEHQPDYYAGKDDRIERHRLLAEEKERFVYLTAHPNELLTTIQGEP